MDKFQFQGLQLFAGGTVSTPSPKNLMLGAGMLYFDRFDDNGAKTGLRPLGNVTSFNVTTTTTNKTKQSSMEASRRDYVDINVGTSVTAKLSLDEYDPENIALILLGETGVETQTAQVGLTTTFNASVGKMFRLGKKKVSNLIIPNPTPAPAAIAAAVAMGTITSDGTVTTSGTYTGTVDADYYITITSANTAAGSIAGTKFTWKKGLSGVASADVMAGATASTLELGIKVLLELTGAQNFVVGDTWRIRCSKAGDAAYTAGVDYKLDALAGNVTILPGSAIPEGAAVEPVFDCAAGTFPKIVAGVDANIQGELYFKGDPTWGPTYEASLWKCSVSPQGDLGMITEDWGSIGIDLKLTDDSENHPDAPYLEYVKLK